MADTVIDRFLAALGSGGAEAALEWVAPDATFEVRGPSGVPIYGRFD